MGRNVHCLSDVSTLSSCVLKLHLHMEKEAMCGILKGILRPLLETFVNLKRNPTQSIAPTLNCSNLYKPKIKLQHLHHKRPTRARLNYCLSDCVRQKRLVSTNRPEGTGVFSEVSEMQRLKSAPQATWTHTSAHTMKAEAVLLRIPADSSWEI